MKRKYVKIDKIIVKDIKNHTITSITQKLDCVKNGSIFVCIEGKNIDSHLFVKQAFEKGAKYVIGTKNINLKNYFKVNNSRKVLAYLLNIFYDFPDKHLDIVGIIGTNGKTSTSYLLKNYCELLKLNSAVIGTNGIYINNDYYKSNLTTPDSEELFYYLDLIRQKEIKYVFIEISAHAIKLEKVFSLKFSRLIFTNFSQDHLDFFKTMQEYKQTKMSIFYDYFYEKAIINTDDKVGLELYNTIKNNKISYGKNGDIILKDYFLNQSLTKIEIITNELKQVSIPLPCKYNVYNFLAVFSCFLSYGFDQDLLIQKALYLSKIKGRFDVINFSKTHTIIIDYAHTPKSTIETLKSVKDYYPESFLITMFGCPGNREQEKREFTARMVSRYSDFCILTSDNPNLENVIKILHQIKKGIKCPSKIIENRTLALKKSVEIFKNKSQAVLLLLGKGIEEYNIVNQISIPYNEEIELKKLLV